MAYHRSTEGAHQSWANLVDDQSFTFQNMLPYLAKSVNFTPPANELRGGRPVVYSDDTFSPKGGPLHVSFWNYFVPASSAIAKGLEKLGLKETNGIQGGSLMGFAQFPATIYPDAQIRDSAQTSFLETAIADESESNLQFYANSIGKRILFDSRKTATGVKVDTAGWEYILSARQEVVLAAGVFRTPQLLMVSGIGPSETLAQYDIPIIARMEGVGQNMQDNPGYGNAQPVNAVTQHRLWNNATYAQEAYEEFYSMRSGPLTAFASNYIREPAEAPMSDALADSFF